MNTHVKTLQPLGMPKGMDPRQWRQSVETRLNDLLDRAMSLITALDLMEVDCDLEETADDEPSLGCLDDLELDNCDDEDDGTTLEPTLGAPERCSQAHWADGSRGDHEREIDHDREWDQAEDGIADADAMHDVLAGAL